MHWAPLLTELATRGKMTDPPPSNTSPLGKISSITQSRHCPACWHVDRSRWWVKDLLAGIWWQSWDEFTSARWWSWDRLASVRWALDRLARVRSNGGAGTGSGSGGGAGTGSPGQVRELWCSGRSRMLISRQGHTSASGWSSTRAYASSSSPAFLPS